VVLGVSTEQVYFEVGLGKGWALESRWGTPLE
jgi:hypothetical protein